MDTGYAWVGRKDADPAAISFGALTDPAEPGTVPAMSGTPDYPITVDIPVDDEERDRWLAAAGVVFMKAVLLLPHLILLFLFGLMIQILVWIGYWGIAFTDTLPDPIRRIEIVFLSWTTRVVAWFAGTVDAYPTFGTDRQYPVTVTVEPAPRPQNRLLAVLGIFLLRTVAALPHFIILFFMSFGVLLVVWIGYIIVVFSGQLPLGVHEFVLNYQRWWARAWGWNVGLTDEYPPFTLA